MTGVGMDPYEPQRAALEREIDKLARLRDAQAPDSRRHAEFQQRIDQLTETWEAWETAGPALTDIDRRITAAQRALDAARGDAEGSTSGWSGGAGLAGVSGGLAVAVSLLWSVPLWVPLAGAALLAAALGCLHLSMRSRRAAAEWLDECQRTVADLMAERSALLPGGGPR